MKHELKRVLKCIRIEIWTRSPDIFMETLETVSDIPGKPNPTAELV